MKAKVFSKVGCPYCVNAKRVLNSKNIPFEEIMFDGVTVTKDSISKEVGRSISTLPQILIDGVYVGGYNELVVFLDGNKK